MRLRPPISTRTDPLFPDTTLFRSLARIGVAPGAQFGRLAGQAPYIAQSLEQIARGHRADVPDAEAEEQPRRIGFALRLDRGKQIVDRFLLPPLDRKSTRLNSSH